MLQFVQCVCATEHTKLKLDNENATFEWRIIIPKAHYRQNVLVHLKSYLIQLRVFRCFCYRVVTDRSVCIGSARGRTFLLEHKHTCSCEFNKIKHV